MNIRRYNFQPRKSVSDFRSENLPNEILYHCLRENTLLPDETILLAFNDAYPICIDVLRDSRKISKNNLIN